MWPAAGEPIRDHVARKYGTSPEIARQNLAALRDQAAAVDVEIADHDRRIWNTFDVHRLLFWAASEDRQVLLATALFQAYFSRGISLADHGAVAQVAGEVGLDVHAAREVLSGDHYSDAVRIEERRWLADGVRAVPFVMINDRYVINGGQPPDKFERALRHIAAEASADVGNAGS